MKAGTIVRIIFVSTLGWASALFAETPINVVPASDPQQPVEIQATPGPEPVLQQNGSLPQENGQQPNIQQPNTQQPNTQQRAAPVVQESVPQPAAPVAQEPVPLPTPVVPPVLPEPVHEEPHEEPSPVAATGPRYSDPEKASFEAQTTRRIEDLAREIGQLETKLAKRPGQKEKLMQEALRTAAGNRSVAKTKLKQLSNAGANDWKALKKGVETAMQELEQSVDRSKGFLAAAAH